MIAPEPVPEITGPVTRQQLETWLAECLDVDVAQLPPPTEDLVDHGLHSVAMMQFVTRCKRSGLDLSVTDLAAEPTIEAWSRRLPAGG
jgi:aryl carrier-like protein